MPLAFPKKPLAQVRDPPPPPPPNGPTAPVAPERLGNGTDGATGSDGSSVILVDGFKKYPRKKPPADLRFFLKNPANDLIKYILTCMNWCRISEASTVVHQYPWIIDLNCQV